MKIKALYGRGLKVVIVSDFYIHRILLIKHAVDYSTCFIRLFLCI